MNQIFTYMLTYGMLFVLFIGLIQFLTNGFFFKFMKVKGSRGKKLMVEVRSKLETYFVVGVIKEGLLIYKDRTSKQIVKKLKLNTDAVYRKLNLNFVNVDEEGNFIINTDGTGVSAYDPLKFEALHIRALMSKEVTDINKFLVATIIIGIITLIVLAILFMKVTDLTAVVDAGIQVVGVV